MMYKYNLVNLPLCICTIIQKLYEYIIYIYSNHYSYKMSEDK